ncbi:ATP-binding protein [Herbaspirillum sp. GCM10030257]|uniref:ATP-binding protein n=1 Tax=Herbaspirillum sp. GCM10030257 TaxID=3273393 RepID=UPI00362283E6
MNSADKQPADLSLLACESEPIHIPGAIQPFGILLTIDPDKLAISNSSENVASLWGIAAPDLLGRSFTDFVSPSAVAAVREYLRHPRLKEQSPLRLKLAFSHENGNDWELFVHEYFGIQYLEIEPVSSERTNASPLSFHLQLRDAIQALQRAGSLEELCRTAAEQVRVITGFDRVMIYRFDEDWHGEVIAEARSKQVASYLGHHFPASDIPAQARAVFLQNWLRMIPDISYTPSKIYPGRHPATGAPLDLGKAQLRSVSPIHLEYLANMQVRASLTVSLINDGQLWGLIACHHAHPLLVDSDTRLAAQLIGQHVSSHIRTKTDLGELDYRVQLEWVRMALLRHMEKQENLAQALVQHAPGIVELVAAQGAAIADGGEWVVSGKTPAVADIEGIVSWLIETHADKPIFQTNSLPTVHPPAAAYKDVASGLLAISIAPSQRNYILLFRPEIETFITWAGEPAKAVRETAQQTTLHPRESFQSWKQEVRGKSLPWVQAEIQAANNLRMDVLAQALRREFRKEQAARKRAEQLTREKEEMVMVVSHDLRTPLSITKMGFDFLQQFKTDLEPAAQRTIERGVRAASAMENLISNILDMAKIEAGTLDLVLHDEDAEQLVREAVDFSLPLAAAKGISLSVNVQQTGCTAYCEKSRIFQVLDNLIGNALKFTAAGGQVTVSIEGCDKSVTFCVSDTGEGIPAQNLEKIFDRFWQAELTRRLGTGLGLSIAKAIIEQHNGRIWAESEVGVGTRFYFTLPNSNPNLNPNP